MDPSILSRAPTDSVFTPTDFAILREIIFFDFRMPGFPVCTASLSGEIHLSGIESWAKANTERSYCISFQLELSFITGSVGELQQLQRPQTEPRTIINISHSNWYTLLRCSVPIWTKIGLLILDKPTNNNNKTKIVKSPDQWLVVAVMGVK